MGNRKVKNYKLLRNYSTRFARALSTITADRARVVEEMFEETDQELSFSEILVPYLKNPSEEDIFGSNNIKEEHEK